MKEKKPNVILKIFNKNGGESEFVKIITEDNEDNYSAQLKGLSEDEKGLIIFKEDDDNWVLITKKRIRSASKGVGYEIFLEDLEEVEHCRESLEAYRHKFILTDKDNNKHTLYFDEINAFMTMTQVIFFLAR
ncbi:hypothetical protein [[Flexibacter] sp. ATCC 35208]|uniref:hypothetical protein n=1 Tax=[Flexibacter] sp. ATCC 35208 TaxID=1936242 RepID=UPI0009C9E84F|nr:hypothetical protein [[Flexibacter] sp. ATCC 35208]OMP75496.1 hypothetical protein BW716_29750 [[Flexibacter] sp. ATCC 35208]